MGDAGKIMRAADGSVLRGPDGRIVRADRLYPSRLGDPAVALMWWRFYAGTGLASPSDLILAQTWEETTAGSLSQCSWQQSGDVYDIANAQRVRKYDCAAAQYVNYPSLSVPWARVAAVVFDWQIVAQGVLAGQTRELQLSAYAGSASADAPSGSGEPWEGSGWALIGEAAVTSPTTGQVLASGTAEATTHATTGVFYTALAYAEYSGPDYVFSSATIAVANIRLKYRLAL